MVADADAGAVYLDASAAAAAEEDAAAAVVAAENLTGISIAKALKETNAVKM
ncbi:MAG: hypothetical protein FWD71_10155 [Oscillospiraceae bacterium]|nr:hypothetical protein [Oscillospiraceae bacterium]